MVFANPKGNKMKPMEQYSNVDYPNKKEYLQSLIDKINADRMTAAEREAALEAAADSAKAWFKLRLREYNDALVEKTKDFWKDCRQDMGYDKFLTENGCQLMEKLAWEKGHANGLSDVHNELCDLADLADELRYHFI